MQGFDKVLWCTIWRRKVPCVMIRFGPHWRNSKITWANIVNAVLDFGTKSIKTHGSKSQGQGGSSKWRPDGLKTHTREYCTGTRVVKIENAVTKEP